MSCCSIASGCGIPVTGCTGTSVAAGHVLVDLSANQIPIYVDTCKEDIYYWDGAKWIILGKDDKFLLYDAASRVLTLQPDGSSVQLPLASTTVAGLVKVNNGSAVSITTDGTLVIDCAKLKQQCGLASTTDLPVSGPVVKIDPSTKQLQVDCAALKTQCNLATVDQIPTVPTVPTYNFGQQASLNGTVLHIANAQDPAAGVDVDLSSLVSSGGAGGGAENYLATFVLNGVRKVGVQTRTKLGILQSIEIVANKVWNGYSGKFEKAGNHPVDTSPGIQGVQGDTQTPMHLAQLSSFPVPFSNQGIGESLYCKIFEGGIILHYSGGSITNSDVCGAPYGLKVWGFASQD